MPSLSMLSYLHLMMKKVLKNMVIFLNPKPGPPPAAFNTFFVCRNANAADDDIQGRYSGLPEEDRFFTISGV
jgi:hypothetical protein